VKNAAMGIRVSRRTKDDGRAHWFEPPRLLTLTQQEERHASWLELFFDLVFVVAIAELSHVLVVDHSAGGFLRFAALFFPVFVAWQGYMAYATRFDTDDLAFRLSYFGAMLAIAAMAVLIGDVAHGENSAAFVIAYVVLRSIMLGLYARAWRAVPEARPLIRFYGTWYAVGAALWLGSLAVEPPWRYVVWVVAQILELSLPPLSTRLPRRIPTDPRHLPERWALFTLIVLGESVVTVAIGTADTHWQASSVAAAVFGFAVIVAVWWLYFDGQTGVALRGSTMSVVVYSYAHIPLLMGLAAMSAGVRLLIERSGDNSLGAGPSVALIGGVLLFLFGLIGARTVTVQGPHRAGVLVKLSAAGVLVALLAAESALPPVALDAMIAVTLAAAVFADRTLRASGGVSSSSWQT
jgi:low temperature requirement protein LtrA